MLRVCSALLVFIGINSFGQDLDQTIRGVVKDAQSKSTLPGATIVLLNTSPPRGVASDLDGKFRLDNVPVGRQGLHISYIGYSPVILENIQVTSAKEIVLNIELMESVVTTKEVVITAEESKAQPLNKMASVSTRTLSIDETNRYAGTLLDPSRMAANFAGVAAAGDQRNDIIIRGNSPLGLLWRMEGINIPNPNHFGSLGTTGGPVSMLNSNTLANSDFLTGAFPAEYGNAIAGAFDLKMRNGNNEKREYTGQMGFNGLELGAEGPFSKKKSGSYMVNYRYSTLEIFDALNISFGVAAVPQYQDVTFKLDFPGLKYGRFSVFGIGGVSYIEFLESERDTTEWSFDLAGTDTRFGSDMGVVGLNHLYFIDKNTRISTSLAVSGTQNKISQDSISLVNASKHPTYGNKSSEGKYSAHVKLSRKMNAKNDFSLGLITDVINTTYKDSVIDAGSFRRLTNTDDRSSLVQAYVQWQHRFSDRVTLNSGLHQQEFMLNNAWAVEPRLGLRAQTGEKSTISFGTGLHSQLQPMSIYFYETQLPNLSYQKSNSNLDFSKSYHLVAGYDYLFNQNFRFKFETYYQHLFSIPVEASTSYYSLLNAGADFGIQNVDSLGNKGKGRNYGIEFTLEKFFSNHYYFLVTTSLYQSKYTGSDGIEHNTAFNGNFVANGLTGYEILLGKNDQHVLDINFKITWAGGKRFIPIDETASMLAKATVLDETQIYEERFGDYFRWDTRISFKKNGRKVSQQWAMDIQNLTNHRNIFQKTFDPVSNVIREEYQLGFFPIFLYRILF